MTTLVVATDGSDLAIEAALSGLSLLKTADRVLVVSVVDGPDASLADDATGHAAASMTDDELREKMRDAKAQTQAAVDTTVAALRARDALPSGIETMVVEGEPGAALCKLASDVDAVALVVGSRGRGVIKRALLGSVSDFVVRHAPCPVVVKR